MNQLDKARKKINEIDEQMAALFEERMKAVEDVILYKKEHDLPVFDQSREQFVIEKNSRYIQNDKYIEYYRSFISQLMDISKQYQMSVIHQDVIGYQGTKGAFSSIAAKVLFPHHRKVNYHSFEAVFQAVLNGDIRYGVVPIENSYTGEVGEILDLLMKYPLYVHQDYRLPISQNLLGIKGATLKDIKQVYSKDQAIQQSQKFLMGRGYECIPYPNTAMAAEYVASCQDKSKAAIAAKETAELYDLEILAEDINTSSLNTTRFIVLSRELNPSGNVFSLAIIIPHKAGALVSAMNIIAAHGFNMQSIISRSIQKRPWEYYFYLEIEGDISQEQEQQLLQELSTVCEKVKILGAYDKEGRK